MGRGSEVRGKEGFESLKSRYRSVGIVLIPRRRGERDGIYWWSKLSSNFTVISGY